MSEQSGKKAKKRIALIGCGSMANSVHYPSLAEFDDLELVGICDLIEEKLHETADRFLIERRFTDYRKMIEQTAPEAVYILMPPHHLFDLVIHALREKLHVFIEKPPAVTRYQTYEMARLAEKNGCLTMVGFNRRFIPLMNRCKEIVTERGAMHQCVATFYKNHIGAQPYYGGAVDILTSDCIHAVDALRWMAGGEFVKVVGHTRCLHMEFPSAFNALVEFDNGCLGVLLGNWACGKRVHTFEMHSKGISAFVNPDPDGEARIYADNKPEGKRITTKEAAGSDQQYKLYGFFQENRHFIDCLQTGSLPQTNFSDALKTMELVEAIYQRGM